MKKIKVFAILYIGLISIQSCNDSVGDNSKKRTGGSFELDGYSLYDTINLIDADGNKQGHWVNKKFADVSHSINSNYATDTVIESKVKNEIEQFKAEEGFYKDNKKKGVWKIFYPSGKIKDSVTYKNGVEVKK